MSLLSSSSGRWYGVTWFNMNSGRSRITLRTRKLSLFMLMFASFVPFLLHEHLWTQFVLLVMSILFGSPLSLMKFWLPSSLVGNLVLPVFVKGMWQVLHDNTTEVFIFVIIIIGVIVTVMVMVNNLSRIELRLLAQFVFNMVLLITFHSLSTSQGRFMPLEQFISIMVTAAALSRLVRERYLFVKEVRLATVLMAGVVFPNIAHCLWVDQPPERQILWLTILSFLILIE